MKYLIPQGVFLLNDPNGVLEAQLPANIRIMRNKKLKWELSSAQSCVALDPECHFLNIRALRLWKEKKKSCKIHSVWSMRNSIATVCSLDSWNDCIYECHMHVLTQALWDSPCSFYNIGCGRKVVWHHLSNQRK